MKKVLFFLIFLIPFVSNAEIIGFVDNLKYNPGGVITINGWSCDREMSEQVEVELYVGAPADEGGVYLARTSANRSGPDDSEIKISAVIQLILTVTVFI